MIFIESPEEVLSFLISNTQSTIKTGSNEYGIIFLFGWVIYSFLALLKFFITASMIIGSYYLIMKNGIFSKFPEWFKILIIIILSWAFCLYSHRFMSPEPRCGTKYFFASLFWIVLFIGIILKLFTKRNYGVQQITKAVICLLLIAAPICLSFGTNMPFIKRASFYISFITPLIVFFFLEMIILE